MQFAQSEKWKPTDKNLYLVHNFTDLRSAFDFITPLKDKVANGTLLSTDPNVI